MKHLTSEIIKFSEERNWRQYHNPKDLAISLSIEASELLENFQWRDSDSAVKLNIDNIRDELADIAIYLLLLADKLEIDLEQAIKLKMDKNAIKYPPYRPR